MGMTTSTTAPAPTQTAQKRPSSGSKTLEGDRIVSLLGAILVLVATALTWYSRDVAVTIGATPANSSSGFSLWDLREVAAWLIAGAAVFGALMPVVLRVDERSAGRLTVFAGLGIVLYSAVAIFQVPALGSGVFDTAFADVTVKTSIGVGPFLAIAGGILLSLGGIATAGDTQIEETL
jgi:hypothetical protein